ncbi:MAG TPA: phenylalanine--tRNA ligase subunit alpha [Verrucomicrobiae bacterium]|nr:phenylalanine--tRNA ligase subunit alpha [Verrucomicrobiae bacterium]
MTEPHPDIATLKADAENRLASVQSAADLEAWRQAFIGRSGQVPLLLRSVKDLPAQERRTLGQAANELRQQLEAAYQAKQHQLEAAAQRGSFDITVPGKRPALGHVHPLTQAVRELCDIFSSMGFLIADGPLVEEARYNFDLLNIPLEHPARAETDTFYLTDGHVLRTHTSPVQIRAVLENHLTPPFRLISPGVVFRAEKADATHGSTFMQMEALMVGKDISIAHFRGIVEAFYSAYFKKKAVSRLLPTFFPFVEPGFQVDLQCIFCEGKGCRVCKQTGWLEMMGAGMVHPSVLKNMNVDPKKWQGFAFGGGIERLVMLKYGVPDMRLFWENDLRFLRQFS